MKICVWLVAELVILGHCDQTSKAKGKANSPSFMSIWGQLSQVCGEGLCHHSGGGAAFSWLGGVSSPVVVSSEG